MTIEIRWMIERATQPVSDEGLTQEGKKGYQKRLPDELWVQICTKLTPLVPHTKAGSYPQRIQISPFFHFFQSSCDHGYQTFTTGQSQY